VSGEPLVLFARPDSDLMTFIETIEELHLDVDSWALIGGIAVFARTGSEHRGTLDIDTLTQNADQLIEVLREHGGEPLKAHSFVVGNAKVDVMEVGEPLLAGQGSDSQIAFALARRFAFDTATVETVSVRGPDGLELAATTLPIATPAALIALKAVSMPDRLMKHRDAAQYAKSTSDAIDLIALVGSAPLERLAVDLAAAPVALQQWVADTLTKSFDTDLSQTLVRLSLAGKRIGVSQDVWSKENLSRVATLGYVIDDQLLLGGLSQVDETQTSREPRGRPSRGPEESGGREP
jgi:hypothetical protein